VKVSTFLIKEKIFFGGERGKFIFGEKMICYYGYYKGGKMM